jgi:ABC-2 type transport system permease protein
MSRLLGVEVRRYLARRLVRVIAALAVLGILIAGTVMFFKSHALDPAKVQAAQQQAEAQRREKVRACSAGEFGIPPSEIPPGESLAQFCSEIIGPAQVNDRSFHLVDLRGAFTGTNGILITLSLLLGASFVGAEWHAGTMTTLLTWEPRRLRVFAAKIAVGAAMAFIGTVAFQALLGGVLTPTALFRGTTAGTDAAWFRGVTGLVLRAASVAAIAATIGGALASIGRNSAAALGIVFGYLAIAEPLLRGWRPGWGLWLVTNNLATFIEGTRSINPEFTSRSPLVAGILIGAYALALASVAGAAFWRRDVT